METYSLDIRTYLSQQRRHSMYALAFYMVISDLQKYYGEPYNKAYYEIKEPSIKIAPLLANFFASIWSAILCLYSIFQIFVDSHAKIQLFFNISSVGWILFPQLAVFRFLSWLNNGSKRK